MDLLSSMRQIINLKILYGILLLSKQRAMGEGLYGFNNDKTFASQLEKHLRKKESSIDLVKQLILALIRGTSKLLDI